MTTTSYKKGKLYDINLSDLQPDPNQPRKSIDAQGLEDMTASVGKLGVIQPIIFRTAADGSLITVAGERRVAAARNAGLATIPAIYIADGNYAEVALVENLLRQDLTSIEEAERPLQNHLKNLPSPNLPQNEDLGTVAAADSFQIFFGVNPAKNR
jgi:ParB family chromosome partitioning protein